MSIICEGRWPRSEDYDADAGVVDMLNDYHETQLIEVRTEEEP
jgi:hypothetical protein